MGKNGEVSFVLTQSSEKIQILTNNCTPLHTELLSEPIREPGEVSVRANFQFQLSFDIAASRGKLRKHQKTIVLNQLLLSLYALSPS